MAGSNRRTATLELRHRSWWTAKQKAESIKHLVIPVFDKDGLWAVTGSTGNGCYLVSRTSANAFSYSCGCPAGRHGNVCWHAAAVAILPTESIRRKRHRDAVNEHARMQLWESMSRLDHFRHSGDHPVLDEDEDGYDGSYPDSFQESHTRQERKPTQESHTRTERKPTQTRNHRQQRDSRQEHNSMQEQFIYDLDEV